jgi:hypothetical protein
MRKTLTIAMLMAFMGLYAQLQPGSIAFIGLNADGDDDISFVALDTIPAGTIIYFCDSEWDGTSFGTDENDFTWTAPSSDVPAGSVITINNLDAANTVNIGSVSGGTGISRNGDAVFAFLGTGLRQPTTFLAAITNISTGFGTLSGTGLIRGLTAIELTNTTDIGQYNGPRSGIDKNGYLSYLNDMTQWLLQDTPNDDFNDGIAPDLPFNTTAFTFSATDVTAPFVAAVNLVNSTTVEVFFSEPLTPATGGNTANYVFNPALAVNSVTLGASNSMATISMAALPNGTPVTLSISGMADPSGNTQSGSFVSDPFFFNNSMPDLVFTEIMYNAPVSFDDDVEFLEIYNAGTQPADLGGIEVLDESNFLFTFPQGTLAPGATVLLSTNAAVADTFYSQSFTSYVNSPANALGNGGEWLVIRNGLGDTIAAVEYDDGSPWPTSPDGGGYSLELKDPAGPQNDASNWTASTSFLKNAEGTDIYCSPGSFSPLLIPGISFDSEFEVVKENAGSVQVALSLSNSTSDTIFFTWSVAPGATAVAGTDYTLPKMQDTILPNSAGPLMMNIPIMDNSNIEADKFFILTLEDLQGAVPGAPDSKTIFITDDDQVIPARSKELQVDFLTSFLVDASGTAEIVAFDEASQRLFVLNSDNTAVEILDFSNPRNINSISSIDLSSYGNGGTSVAVMNGIVAASIDAGVSANGSVVFMDINGNLLSSVTVGNLPDMVTFTPDGNSVLTANEGQPNAGYTIDPEGSVSKIDISGGVAGLTQANVTNISFTSFNSQKAALQASGVRIFGLNATVAQDVEPEFITVSDDSQTAWVTLQENNAVAVVDLATNAITAIVPLGTKDHSLQMNSIDASDRNDSIVMGTYPLHGMYMPDAIANYTMGGVTYLVTANEGDQREYGVIDEDISIGDAVYVLDSATFPEGDLLKQNHLLGRLAVSPYSGDTDGDGDFDEIHVFGSRSFSIWNGNTGALVYDSGDDFERITSTDPIYKSLFNASNSNNNFKNRSDNKGPEPEGVTVAHINNQVYAFITLERVGGMMVYNITDPANVVLVDYVNSRTLGPNEGGDLGPEGIIYLGPDVSPNDTALVIMANEVSATLSVYALANVNAASTAQVKSLSLIDASNGSVVKVLADGDTIDKSMLPMFSIEADTSGNLFGSVVFEVNGTPYSRENGWPYAINGGSTTKYKPWNPVVGTYVISATPYSMSNARGVRGMARSVTVHVIDTMPTLDCNGDLGGTAYIDSCGVCVGGNTGKTPCVGGCTSLEVVSFDLVSSMTGKAMRPLNDGDTLYLGSMGSFTIRANTCDGIVGSVIFDLNGSYFSKENLFPYDIMGGGFSSPNAFVPPVGTHTIAATPYDGKNGRGMMGIAETVTFHVVAGMAPRTAGNGTTNPTDQNVQQSALGGTAALDASSQMELILFPNPTNGTATLSEPVAYSLYSLMGQEVRKSDSASDVVDVKGLAKGTYVLITTDGRSLKVVVN